MSTKQLALTAHHEAGHAVAGFWCEMPVKYVTIEPNAGSRGHAKHGRVKFADHGMFDDSVRGIDRAERAITVLFAGPLAMRKFAPRSQWRVSGGSDFPEAAKLFMRICGEDEECQRLYYKLLWRRAELLVEFRWKDIRAVAADLLGRRRLDRLEVRAAIDRAHGLKPFVLNRDVAAR